MTLTKKLQLFGDFKTSTRALPLDPAGDFCPRVAQTPVMSSIHEDRSTPMVLGHSSRSHERNMMFKWSIAATWSEDFLVCYI